MQDNASITNCRDEWRHQSGQNPRQSFAAKFRTTSNAKSSTRGSNMQVVNAIMSQHKHNPLKHATGSDIPHQVMLDINCEPTSQTSSAHGRDQRGLPATTKLDKIKTSIKLRRGPAWADKICSSMHAASFSKPTALRYSAARDAMQV